MDYRTMFFRNMKLFVKFKKNAVRWNDPVDLYHMMDYVQQCRLMADIAINTNFITTDEYYHMHDLIFKMQEQAFSVAISIRSSIWDLLRDYSRKEDIS